MGRVRAGWCKRPAVSGGALGAPTRCHFSGQKAQRQPFPARPRTGQGTPGAVGLAFRISTDAPPGDASLPDATLGTTGPTRPPESLVPLLSLLPSLSSYTAPRKATSAHPETGARG